MSGKCLERSADAMANPLRSPFSRYLRPEATFSPPISMAPERIAVIPLTGAVIGNKLEFHTGLGFQDQPIELTGRAKSGADFNGARCSQGRFFELGKVVPRNILAGADNIRRRGQQRNGFEVVVVEWNPTIEITGNSAFGEWRTGCSHQAWTWPLPWRPYCRPGRES